MVREGIKPEPPFGVATGPLAVGLLLTAARQRFLALAESLAFDGGLAEAVGVSVGEWHSRARFSPLTSGALALSGGL